MDRGAWPAAVPGVRKGADTTWRLNTATTACSAVFFGDGSCGESGSGRRPARGGSERAQRPAGRGPGCCTRLPCGSRESAPADLLQTEKQATRALALGWFVLSPVPRCPDGPVLAGVLATFITQAQEGVSAPSALLPEPAGFSPDARVLTLLVASPAGGWAPRDYGAPREGAGRAQGRICESLPGRRKPPPGECSAVTGSQEPRGTPPSTAAGRDGLIFKDGGVRR